MNVNNNKYKLNKRLAEIQQNLNAPKNQRNSFGKYNYRSCEDILMAVKPLVRDLTLQVTDEIVLVGERYYVKATATITDGIDSIHTTAFAREEETKKGMDASQITGSASSYARKYALNGLLMIDDNKDADTMDNRGEGNMETPGILLRRIVESTDEKSLRQSFENGWKSQFSHYRDIFKAAYQRRKAELGIEDKSVQREAAQRVLDDTRTKAQRVADLAKMA